MSGKLDGHSYPGTPKNFQTTHIGYRAHRAVIFAIAWHLVTSAYGPSQPVQTLSPSASDSLATNGAIEICIVLYCIVLYRVPTVKT